MCERPKVHVFLGAPPPGREEPRPAAWSHLELTWQDGHLRPVTDDALEGNKPIRDEEASSSGADWPTEQSSASLHEYLDSCFPSAQPQPEPGRCSAAVSSAQTQFLCSWTLSQALILRGRRGVQSAASPDGTTPEHAQTPPSVSSSTPELFSPAPPSPGGSVELFSEGGVVVQPTSEGLLCSQSCDPPSKPAHSEKARTAETEATVVPAASGRRGATTLLKHCDQRGVRYSVLVVVVHPCHLKEVQVKSGPAAGTAVPLASIVVTDQSGVEMKVVMWRQAAFWTLAVSPGDVLLMTGLQVNEDRWRGETVLQSTFSSKLLILGPITSCSSPPAPQHVDSRCLSSLCGFLRQRRPLLLSPGPQQPQDLNRLPYATLRSLKVNSLVHALLRVTHAHIAAAWRSEAESRCRTAVQQQVMLTVEQVDGQQAALLLWGSAVKWLPRFSRDKDAIWDFHVLLVREGSTSDLPELHSTPWSSVRPLDPTSRQAQDFLWARVLRTGSSCLELDVNTLLSQKYSGEVELRVQVISFHFLDSQPSQNAPQPVMDSSTPLDGILAALGGDITYTGCGRCTAELDTDANGIYGPCFPCLPHTAVRRYYRPGVLSVSEQAGPQLCLQVPPVPLQNILQAPPDKLLRSSAPGSDLKYIQVAAGRIQTLLFLPRNTFIITVRSHFLCDENSVPISQDFTLLDLQFPS